MGDKKKQTKKMQQTESAMEKKRKGREAEMKKRK